MTNHIRSLPPRLPRTIVVGIVAVAMVMVGLLVAGAAYAAPPRQGPPPPCIHVGNHCYQPCQDPSGLCPPSSANYPNAGPVPTGFTDSFNEEFTSLSQWSTHATGAGSSVTADGTAQIVAGAHGGTASLDTFALPPFGFGPYGYVSLRARLLGPQYGSAYLDLTAGAGSGQDAIYIGGGTTAPGNTEPEVGVVCYGGTQVNSTVAGLSVTDWHTYAVAWTPNSAVFTVDGTTVFSVTICGTDLFPNVALPFEFGVSTTTAATGTSRLQVDWTELDTCNSGHDYCP